MRKDDRPDLVCIINLGFIGGYSTIVNAMSSEPSDGYICGVALLQQRDDKGQRIEKTHVIPQSGTMSAIYKDAGYPVTKVNKELRVVEPSRALLIFCEALVRVLADQNGRPVPAFSHYITSVARDLFLLD